MENPKKEAAQFEVSAPVPKETLQAPPPAPAPVEQAEPPPFEAAPPLPKSTQSITWPEFLASYGLLDRQGQPVESQEWDEIPELLLNVIGDDKMKAREAAHAHRCWTVTKDEVGKLGIDAGMNAEDREKIGYLITQKPWEHLGDSVVQSLS